MMMTPTTTGVFAMVVLCVVALLATGDTAKTVADDLVVNACFNVTDRYHQYGPGLTRSSCEMALWSDKRSMSAKHPRDLALVAMALVQEGAAVAGAKVAASLSSGDRAKLSKGVALILRYCQLDYEAIAHTAPVCRDMVQEYDTSVDTGDGNNMIAYDYLECANKLMNAASGCWGRISFDYETRKVVWKEVDEVASRANLARAMVENMVRVVDGDFADHFIDDGDDVDTDNDSSDHHRHGDNHHHGHHHRRGPDTDDDDDDLHHHGHHGHDDD